MNIPQETVVSETGEGQFTQKIIIGNHILTADEPIINGGKDTGPSPYDFLLAALGSCTSMTLRMYAKLKQFPLENVIVRLKHEKIHVDDCIGCENNNSKLDHIERLIELEGTLTQEQRTKLLEIADKCPVHRTLTSKIIITTKLVENQSK
ncbi:TPA: OsmC family protein [Legionella pneumophila]|uniref:OsmC family protein n=1 Tax=Legionella pneumophila TaxID=446 RepID=A0AAN5Q1J0_LEGPN|nr:OsmC family protein [Legionella pneumophila]HCC3252076.1 OsmC family protein [Legionella pneumophila subsp. pneumophila]AMV15231.1 OsmC-like protein [Legionella pneumophila]MBN5929848.1 OsmC family protein [Legionella pneumophila]MDF1929952.1 OsmC family protein [Legionella pneumophila]PYB44006.1 OsmC family peroxiredoxin [Legionella pneumophila]